MSVDYCVMWCPPQQFAELHHDPAQLSSLVDAYYSRLLDARAEKDCVDARDAYKGGPPAAVPAVRMLHIDEFTTSLLVSFMEQEQTTFYFVNTLTHYVLPFRMRNT